MHLVVLLLALLTIQTNGRLQVSLLIYRSASEAERAAFARKVSKIGARNFRKHLKRGTIQLTVVVELSYGTEGVHPRSTCRSCFLLHQSWACPGLIGLPGACRTFGSR